MVSLPLKTKKRHCCDEGGLRASGGSWYLRTVVVPATVFASFARRPVELKFGFCFSKGLPSASTRVPVAAAESLPRKEASWEASAVRDLREGGEGGGLGE